MGSTMGGVLRRLGDSRHDPLVGLLPSRLTTALGSVLPADPRTVGLVDGAFSNWVRHGVDLPIGEEQGVAGRREAQSTGCEGGA